MALHNDIGKWGEDVAANLLLQKGYRILERNWHCEHLEVDIVAHIQKTIVFVEVKTRTSTFGNKLPEEYVTKEKEANICRAAQIYVKRKMIDDNIRFDIISIIVDPANYAISRLEHLEEAFFPPMRTIHTNSYSGHYTSNRYKKRKFLI